MGSGRNATLRQRATSAHEEGLAQKAKLASSKRKELIKRGRLLLEDRFGTDDVTVISVDLLRSSVEFEVEGIHLLVSNHCVFFGRTGKRILSLEGLGELLASDRTKFDLE